MIVWVFLLLASLCLLYAVSEKAEEELVKFAEYSGITHLAVGFIFLAAATSLPELSISIASTFLGNQEISAGVSIGNVLYDLLLILPIVSILYGVKISEKNFMKIKLFSLISLLVLSPLLLIKSITRVYGIFLVISFLVLSAFLLRGKTKYRFSSKKERFRNKLSVGVLLVVISFLSFLINLSARKIAEATNISMLVIGSILVSLFTSSPELFTCLAAAKRRNYDVVIGTLYGTLVFDTMFVLGSTSVLAPIIISNFNHFLLLYFFLLISLISIILILLKEREINVYSSIFLLVLLAFWIFLSVLIGI